VLESLETLIASNLHFELVKWVLHATKVAEKVGDFYGVPHRESVAFIFDLASN